MSESFKTGDLVELKSGGPTMTVKEKVSMATDKYICQWFGGKKLESGTFPAGSLVRATPDEKKTK